MYVVYKKDNIHYIVRCICTTLIILYVVGILYVYNTCVVVHVVSTIPAGACRKRPNFRFTHRHLTAIGAMRSSQSCPCFLAGGEKNIVIINIIGQIF